MSIEGVLNRFNQWRETPEAKMAGSWAVLALGVSIFALSLGFAVAAFSADRFDLRPTDIWDKRGHLNVSIPIHNHSTGMGVFSAIFGIGGGTLLSFAGIVKVCENSKKINLRNASETTRKILMLVGLAVVLFGITLTVGSAILQGYQDAASKKYYSATLWETLQNRLTSMQAGGISTAVIGGLIFASGVFFTLTEAAIAVLVGKWRQRCQEQQAARLMSN